MKRFFMVFVVCFILSFTLTGCAKQYIANQVKNEAAKQVENFPVEETAASMTLLIAAYASTVIRKYIKNKAAADFVLAEMARMEKDMEYVLIDWFQHGKGKVKEMILNIDASKPIGPQLIPEIRKEINAIKEAEVVKTTTEKFGVSSEKAVSLVKQNAPRISPTLGPVAENINPENVKKPVWRSEATQGLIEKLRAKYQ